MIQIIYVCAGRQIPGLHDLLTLYLLLSFLVFFKVWLVLLCSRTRYVSRSLYLD